MIDNRNCTRPSKHVNVTKPIFDPTKVQTVSTKPRIYVYENFLSIAECAHIIELGGAGLQRSQVAGAKSNVQSNVRTSYGTFLNSTDDPILLGIEERISVWTQLPVNNGEPFYLLRYSQGQEYKPHYDYFDPKLPGMERFLIPGQRTATVLLYLHTPRFGGETTFPKANILVPTVRGTAVLFWSHTNDHQLDTNSLHGSLPVKEGVKYCCTKWLRENEWVV